MALTDWQKHRLALDSYVLADAGMVYMASPKAACTSFKHVVAALHGVDYAVLSSSLMAAKTNDLGIHDRAVVNQPSLMDLSDEVRAHILRSTETLRFCIVREPFRRLASAWLDRILCHSLSPIAPILKHIEFPAYVPDWSYLRERFAEFVDHLYRHESPHFSNHHWQTQTELLLLDVMNYNLVMRLEKLADGVALITRHLDERGLAWPGLPIFNETPVKYSSRLYSAATARKVAEMYEADFKAFDYPSRFEAGGKTPELPDTDYIQAIQKRNQRIFYLSLKVRGMI